MTKDRHDPPPYPEPRNVKGEARNLECEDIGGAAIKKDDVLLHLIGGIAIQIVGSIIGAIVISPLWLLLPLPACATYIDMKAKLNSIDRG